MQRWSHGRSSYRPVGEPIDPRQYDVVALAGKGADTIARRFVLAHHYSGSYPAAVFRFGLYRADHLVGVAVFSVPAHPAVLTNVFGTAPAVELGRFVLLDEVPANGESWFIAQAFARLRPEGVAAVLSHVDPVPRVNDAGELVFKGHVGTIYQAANGRYLGRARAKTLRLLPDGTVLSDRALSKLRAGDKGWQYTARLLIAAGAAPIDTVLYGENTAKWASTWVPRVTRAVRHPGNHRYAWALDRALALPAGARYPKTVEPAWDAGGRLL